MASLYWTRPLVDISHMVFMLTQDCFCVHIQNLSMAFPCGDSVWEATTGTWYRQLTSKSIKSFFRDVFFKSRSLPHALQISCVDKWSSSTIWWPFGTFVDAGTAVGEGSGETLSHSLSGADLTRFCIRLDALIDWNRPDLCLTFPSMVPLSSPSYTQNKHQRSIVAIFLH